MLSLLDVAAFIPSLTITNIFSIPLLLLLQGHIEEIGNEPLMKTIRQLGGWPVLGEKSGWIAGSEKSFDWLDLLIQFRRMGFSHDVLIDLSVTPDFRNNTKHIIDVSLRPFIHFTSLTANKVSKR